MLVFEGDGKRLRMTYAEAIFSVASLNEFTYV